MREILFAALLLGCAIAEITAIRDGFEFYDTQGRCWRCLPGTSCVRCPHDIFRRNAPTIWDRTCPRPTEATCNLYPNARFPSLYARFFYQCGQDGQHVRVECPCDKVFDMLQQNCVYGDEITSMGCNSYTNSESCPCGQVCPAPEDPVDPPEPCPECPPGLPPPPTVWDRTCPRPSNATCTSYPNSRFPSTYARFFYQCGVNGQSIRVECPCGQVFDMSQQICVPGNGATPNGCDSYTDILPCPCGQVCPAPEDPVDPTDPPEPCPECPKSPNPPAPDTWDKTCPRPSNETCTSHPNARFPSTYARFFYQCGVNGQSIRVECDCDKVFDMRQQTCVYTDELTSIGCTNYDDKDECPCGGDPCPGPPNDDNGNGVTTPAPCVCVVWWPCWCNPCWNMPCHSCHGCIG